MAKPQCYYEELASCLSSATLPFAEMMANKFVAASRPMQRIASNAATALGEPWQSLRNSLNSTPYAN